MLFISIFFLVMASAYSQTVTDVACEGDTLSIACPTGKTIVVKSALYGRQDATTCTSGPIHTTTCQAMSSLAEVTQACEGKASCTIGANNGVFGDPCGGTYKYLRVEYECRYMTEVACEGDTLSITCPAGKAIVVKSALYGRQDATTCTSGPIHTTTCEAVSSLAEVKQACEGKASCTIGANNGVFGDPCGGTYKYLRVEYECRNTCYFGKDLALVFDIAGGKTQQEHSDIVDFGKELVNLVQGDDLTQLAVISYDTEARMRVSLKEWSKSDATGEIFNVFTNWEASRDRTHRAMNCLREQTFTEDYGDRPSVPNVAFIVTDRKSSDPPEAILRAIRLKASGTTVFVINIANALSSTEALNYATNSDHVWDVASYADLVDDFDTFKDMAFDCE